jgi:hypothetical protein
MSDTQTIVAGMLIFVGCLMLLAAFGGAAAERWGWWLP